MLKDTRLDRTVAIKVLSSHLSNPDPKQRFEREARTISSLSHPNICALYDIGHQDGIDFLVMEFLEGETLAQRLSKGTLPMDQVLRYGMQISHSTKDLVFPCSISLIRFRLVSKSYRRMTATDYAFACRLPLRFSEVGRCTRSNETLDVSFTIILTFVW